MMKRCVLFVLLVLSGSLYAQDREYASEMIRKLSSPGFHGRGYYKKGDLKAARFIRDQFRKSGLEKLGEDYLQEFPMSINVIKGTPRLWINGKLMQAGNEFLIAAFSPSTRASFKPVFLLNDSLYEPGKSLRFENDSLAGRIIITDRYHQNVKRNNYLGAPVIILKEENENLWWHVSNARQPSAYIVAEVKRKAAGSGELTSVKAQVKSKFYPDYRSQNVAGYIPGASEPDTFIVFTAHYDHLGRMGKKTYFPGANDNASGVAMIMDLARYYAAVAGKSAYSIAFIALGGEEAGLLGSKFFAEHPLLELSRIKFLINLDMTGTGSDGITIVNGEKFRTAFDTLQNINDRNQYLSNVKIRGESCNSDHCPFYEKGVPSVFIYTMGDGYSEYHTVDDKAATLPLTGYNGLFQLLTGFVHSLEKFNPKH